MSIKELRAKYKKQLQEALAWATCCSIQGPGYKWPCGSCFFAMQREFDELTNQDWQLTLFIRGDYKKKELDNLPDEKDWEERVLNIIKIAKEK